MAKKKTIASVDRDIVTIEGRHYRFRRHIGDDIESIVASIRREPDHWNGILVCDMKMDCGGCGKDALKLNIGVPISIFLNRAASSVEKADAE
jgi:hypothetical protein